MWNSPAFDPETNVLFVPSVQRPLAARLEQPPAAGSDVAYVLRSSGNLLGPRGLPTPFKPPYGRLTAIDLNKGEILWKVANGDGPRNHPALKGLNLPPLGQGGRVAPLVTKTMVFMGEGTNDNVDRRAARIRWENVSSLRQRHRARPCGRWSCPAA